MTDIQGGKKMEIQGSIIAEMRPAKIKGFGDRPYVNSSNGVPLVRKGQCLSWEKVGELLAEGNMILITPTKPQKGAINA